MNPSVALPQALIHCRGSFGLPTTNFMYIPGLLGYDGGAFRFSLGQESHAELIEHFYFFSRVMGLIQKPIDCASICAHVQTLVDQGLPTEQKPARKQMSLAQQLSAIGHDEAPALDDQERLNGTIATMRRALKMERSDQRFTLNKIVSTLGVLETIASWKSINLETSRERPELDAMVEGVIKSGMPGVSANGRNLIYTLQARLCQHDFHSPDAKTRGKAIETLMSTMERSDAACLYFMERCKIPNESISEQLPRQQQRLVRSLFKKCQQRLKQNFWNGIKNYPVISISR